MSPPTPLELTATGGVGLHALAWEGGAGHPVLLVHGLSSNGRTWEGVGERLAAAGHPVVAVDLRGHGRSDKPDRGYDFATMVADLAAVLGALGWERPVVVGQSTGGNLAVQLAASEPGVVGAVVGVDGGVLDLASRWPAWEDCEAALAPPVLVGTPAATIEAHLRRAHPAWSDEGIAATLANLEVLADGTVRPWLTRERHLRILRALWEQRPLDLVEQVKVPLVLVLARAGDPWHEPKRAAAARAAALNPRVRVEWLTGDHDLHVEQPDTVARLVAEVAEADVGEVAE